MYHPTRTLIGIVLPEDAYGSMETYPASITAVGSGESGPGCQTEWCEALSRKDGVGYNAVVADGEDIGTAVYRDRQFFVDWRGRLW